MDAVPIHHDAWKNGHFPGHQDADQRPDLTFDRFLAKTPDAFEAPYVRVGKAWQNWIRDGAEVARPKLEELVDTLPRGNVARGTARALLARMDRKEGPPSRLEFVAD